MKIEALLEKKEYTQVTILRQLILQGGSLTAAELRRFSGVSVAAFEQYVKELEELDCGVTFVREHRMIRLTLAAEVNLEQIIASMLTNSLKYQILEYLLINQEFAIWQLVNEFATSESSIFRKIKELNQLLAEFGIQIKNGQWQGEELQVRYFYYQLYQFFPENQKPALFNQKSETIFLQGFEGILETKLTELAKDRLLCWLAISRKRLKERKTHNHQLLKKRKIYQDDPLYQKIDTLVSLYLHRSAVEMNPYESLMLYSFVTVFDILDVETFYRYDLTRSKKIPPAMLDLVIREGILYRYKPRRLSIQQEKSVGYQLAQLNNELYFFSGKLFYYCYEHLQAQQQQVLGETFDELLAQLQKEALQQLAQSFNKENGLHVELLTRYGAILAMIEYFVAQSIAVGIYLESLPHFRQQAYQFLVSTLQSVGGIHIEPYQKGGYYDLIISNQPLATSTPVYVLSEFESAYDSQQIKELLEKLKKNDRGNG